MWAGLRACAWQRALGRSAHGLHLRCPAPVRQPPPCRCGNVAAILELDDGGSKNFKVGFGVRRQAAGRHLSLPEQSCRQGSGCVRRELQGGAAADIRQRAGTSACPGLRCRSGSRAIMPAGQRLRPARAARAGQHALAGTQAMHTACPWHARRAVLGGWVRRRWRAARAAPGRLSRCCCPAAQVFEAAPQEARGVPSKKAAPDYFL